jgi:addiction module HigA family antidote
VAQTQVNPCLELYIDRR